MTHASESARNETDTSFQLTLPSSPFTVSAAVALLLPLVARLCWVPVQGWPWVTQYIPAYTSIMALVVAVGVQFIPAFAWWLSAYMSKKAPVAYWFSMASGVAFLLKAHGGVDLTGSSTAGIAVLIIPFYAIAAIAVGWVLGRIVHYVLHQQNWRRAAVGVAGLCAVIFGTPLADVPVLHTIGNFWYVFLFFLVP